MRPKNLLIVFFSFVFCGFCCVFVVFLLCLYKYSVSPLEKRVFLLFFQCLPLFHPSFSHFPFSLSHSLSLSLYLVFFLSSSFIVCVFSSLFFVFIYWLVALRLFHAKNSIKKLHLEGCFHQCFLFFVLVLSLTSPFLIFIFLISKLWPHLTKPFFVGVLVFLVCSFVVWFFVVFALFLLVFVCFFVGMFLVFFEGGLFIFFFDFFVVCSCFFCLFVFVLECVCVCACFCFSFTCCVFLVCFCFVVCVCWSGFVCCSCCFGGGIIFFVSVFLVCLFFVFLMKSLLLCNSSFLL